MAMFRDPARIVFIDEDNTQLAVCAEDNLIPRAGDNVRIQGVPYVVERVGYDLPKDRIEAVWVVCRLA